MQPRCAILHLRALPHFKSAGIHNNRRLSWRRQRNTSVDDKLPEEVMNLLMSGWGAPRRGLVAWPGFGEEGEGASSNLELQPPNPPAHSLPIPHPETPQLNKVPQVAPISSRYSKLRRGKK